MDVSIQQFVAKPMFDRGTLSKRFRSLNSNLMILFRRDIQKYPDYDRPAKHLEDTILYGDKKQILQLLSQRKNIKSHICYYTGNTILHLALRNNKLLNNGIVEILDILINRGADPNIKNYRKKTPLHFAITTWNKEVVDYLLLLQHDGKIDVTDDQRYSWLFRIFLGNLGHRCYHEKNPKIRAEEERKSADFIEWLLLKGFDCDCVIENNQSALHLAIEYNLQNILPAMLRHTRDIDFLNESNNKTLLHAFLKVNFDANNRANKRVPSSAFSRRYDIEIVRIMLKRGISVDHEDNDGYTALHLAIDAAKTKKHMKIVKMLFDRFTKFRNSCGESLLCSLIQYPNNEYYHEILATMIAKGVNVNARNKHGKTPMYFAVSHKNLRATVKIKENGADFSVITNLGYNLLHALVSERTNDAGEIQLREKILDLLVSQGCDVNSQNNSGETPLHLALRNNCDIIVIQKIIALSADVNGRDQISDSTPLHLAVKYGLVDVVKLLLEKGANVNSQSRCHGRPLHLPVLSKNTKVLKILLGHKAEVNARDSHGKSVIYRAFHNNCHASVKELLDYGADINDIRIIRSTNHADKLLLRHFIKLNTANLPCSEKRIFYVKFYQTCLGEVEILRRIYIDSQTSLYQWLHMDPNRRYLHNHNKTLRTIINSPMLANHFPQYSTIILGCYRETEARRRLLEPAKKALIKLIQLYLPDICLERILAHLNTGYLLEIIESADVRICVDSE